VRRGQATPGASLISEHNAAEDAPADTPDDGSDGAAAPALGQSLEQAPERAGRPASRRLLGLVGGVAAVVLTLDQTTKALAVAHLTENQPRDLVGSALRLHLVRNAGAAFSTATGMTWVLTVIALAVVVVVLRVARRLGSRIWALTLGLLLGGALGNLTDRLFRAPGVARGHVVDLLEFPHWPIWNLADASIVTAGVLVVILTLRGVGLEGDRRHE
jgi:signal peptidase II